MTSSIAIIRPLNIVLIALSMFLTRHCLILPAFETEKFATGEMPVHLDRIHFLLLVFGTCCIAAAGNVINDRFDVTADSVNKPGRNIVDVKISKSTAEYVFYSLSAIGSAPGIYLGMKLGKTGLALLLPFCAFSLWMYSSYYKRRLLSGNLLIAGLTSVMVVLPGLFEPEFYRNIIYLLIYGILAFLVTMAREIVKDIEDLDGDERMQCKTLPIRYGRRAAGWVAGMFLLMTTAFISGTAWYYFRESTVVHWLNICIGLCAPLAFCLYQLIKAEEKSDYHFIASFLKGYLAFGLLTMVPFWYYFIR